MKHPKLILLPIVGTMMLASCVKPEQMEPKSLIFFSDEKFKAYCVENFDIDGDGEISEDEANAVKEIDCSNMELTSLADIEYFSNLDSLNCSGNILTTLDVSKNTSLTSMDISDNDSLLTLKYTDGLKIINDFVIGRYINVNGVGGVVFSASKNATKIMSIDETEAEWGYYGTTTGATDNDDGVANTNKIAEGSPAAQWCRAKGSAWYFPAWNEMKGIYYNKATLNSTLDSIGGTMLTETYYWSSTEGNSHAYLIHVSDGPWYIGNKNYSYRVRAVRAL